MIKKLLVDFPNVFVMIVLRERIFERKNGCKDDETTHERKPEMMRLSIAILFDQIFAHAQNTAGK